MLSALDLSSLRHLEKRVPEQRNGRPLQGRYIFLMIIRNRTTKTLEASPLNNRGCAVPPDRDKKGNIDPEGVAHYAVRALFQSACLYSACYPGVLATLVPSVIERRPRCGLLQYTVS